MPQLSPEEIMQKVSTGKPFTVLLLIAGKPAPEDLELVNDLQMKHLAHLFQMEAEGKSCLFGPMINDEKFRGLIVFNTTDKELIHEWMATDPWVRGGYLTYELYSWFTIPGQRIPD